MTRQAVQRSCGRMEAYVRRTKHCLPLLMLLVFGLSTQWAMADSLTFFDTGESSPFVVGSGARMASSLTCTFPTFPNAEEADCSFLTPPGASRSTSVLVGNFFIGDPGGITISDFTPVSVPFDDPAGSLVLVDFISDSDAPGGLGLCGQFGGCPTIENGTVQTVLTFTWKDANGTTLATDTINFQSDVDSVVPEPSSLLLLVGGLFMLVEAKRRCAERGKKPGGD